MRRALCGALLCGAVAAVPARAQDRPVTFEETQPVTITGFAVARSDYDRLARANSFTAAKLALSLFKPVGDAYLFGQLTTTLAGGESSVEIDNLIVSWTPHGATRWSFALGRFDAPIGFERDDEPLNFLPTSSFTFELARPAKLTGAVARFTASPAVELTAAVANGWNAAVDNNRDKTALLRAQWIADPRLTIGVSGVYGPERDGTSGHPRALLAGDATLDAGALIVGAEVDAGREREGPGASRDWTGAAVTGFLRLGRRWGVSGRADYVDDSGGVLGAGTVLESLTLGPMWFFRSAQEGIFSNIEHTRFHLPQVAIRTGLRLDYARAPYFSDADGALQRRDTRAVVELVYLF